MQEVSRYDHRWYEEQLKFQPQSTVQPSGPKHLKLGERVDGVVLNQKGGRRFEIRARAAPHGWKVELHTLRPENVELGASGSFWVAKIAPLHRSILVHDGDFGRLPVSDAMRPRYLASLNAMLGDDELTGDRLADAQTMVARIEQRNHADWLTVWQILGEPESGDVKRLLASINAIRKARKESPELVPELSASLTATFGESLALAVKRLASKRTSA